ncbi:MAG: hypothetical protein ACFFAY_13045 [Promethearchaeota archaeon]
MNDKLRIIFLALISLYGIIYTFVFSTAFVAVVLDRFDSSWDALPFFPGLADADNLYLIFGTLGWLIIPLLCSIAVAGFFMILHRIMRTRKLTLETIESRPSLFRLITRAIIPALFSFSIANTLVPYLRRLSFFEPPGMGTVTFLARLDLFVIRTLHLSLLLLPITLLIFIPTWILNDFVVVSHRTGINPGEYSDPQKVGQWVSGLLSGFSAFAFPIAYLDLFIIDPIRVHGWIEVADTLPQVLLIMTNTIILLIAFVLPIIILYELGRTRIAKYFYRVAKRLNVENTSLLRPRDSPIADGRPIS